MRARIFERMLNVFSVGWLFVILASGIDWILKDKRAPAWDPARYLANSMDLLDIFSGVGDQHYLFEVFRYYENQHPMLVQICTLPFYLLFGKTYDVAQVSILLIWVPLLFFSTRSAGRILFGRAAGDFSAVMAISFPIILGMSKDYFLDVPLTALVALNLFLLLRSNLLLTSSVKRVIWVGVGVGLGMLCKVAFPIFLVYPAGIAVLRGLRRAPVRIVRNGLLTLSVAFLIAGPWYLKNWKRLREDVATVAIEHAKREGDPSVLSWKSVTWYPEVLRDTHLYLPLTLGAAFCALIALRKRRSVALFILGSMAVAYVVATLTPNKDPRYIMPVLPYVAFLLAVPMPARSVRIKVVWAGVGMAVCLFHWYAITYGIPQIPHEWRIGPLRVYAQGGYVVGHPRRDANGSAQLVKDIHSTWACMHREGTRYPVLWYDIGGYQQMELYGILYYTKLWNGPIFMRAQQPDFILTHPAPGKFQDRFVPIGSYPTDAGDVSLLLDSAAKGLGRGVVFPAQDRKNKFCLRDVIISPVRTQPGGRIGIDTRWASLEMKRPSQEWVYLHLSGPAFLSYDWEVQSNTWSAGSDQDNWTEYVLPASAPPGEYDLLFGFANSADGLVGLWDGALVNGGRELKIGKLVVQK